MKFIKTWNKLVSPPASYRFSGGEPLMLGNRLFELAERAYETTGLKPYILSAGNKMNGDWVAMAKQSAISHVFLSVENPIKPDKGSVDPKKLIKQIKDYDSDEMPLLPGVCVVSNENFEHLYDICKWFYNELGKIPPICEINYGAYKSPSDMEWQNLEDNLRKIVEDFFPKTHLNIFSSVAPEYAYGGHDPYLFELNLDNSHKINNKNTKQKIKEVKSYVETHSYPKISCPNIDCPWLEFCKNTKWYWQIDQTIGNQKKIKDYCKFKRIISDVFFQVLIDPHHKMTKDSIA
jgi:hypothetical protein